ncbi:hypothetical protein MRB53_008067 [Persea americana]|uniref:Uncharacterized protein n=1 Tax=Persea americana TaxID=3435 RepID=A0ACC2MLW6_PERAE|nr:hypothetical protein MRB53_008067 [Persea americana]
MQIEIGGESWGFWLSAVWFPIPGPEIPPASASRSPKPRDDRARPLDHLRPLCLRLCLNDEGPFLILLRQRIPASASIVDRQGGGAGRQHIFASLIYNLSLADERKRVLDGCMGTLVKMMESPLQKSAAVGTQEVAARVLVLLPPMLDVQEHPQPSLPLSLLLSSTVSLPLPFSPSASVALK